MTPSIMFRELLETELIIVGGMVRSRHIANNFKQLQNYLQIKWNIIPANVVQRYVKSIRRCIEHVIRQICGHTRY